MDSSAALLGDGYLFGLRRFRQHHTDVFRTRLMGRNAVIGYGEEFAEAVPVLWQPAASVAPAVERTAPSRACQSQPCY